MSDKITRVELLKKLKIYIDDPSQRALTADGGCMYRHEGRRCLFGQCIPDGLYNPHMEGRNINDIFDDYPEVEELFSEGVLDEWDTLQMIHDDPRNWCDSGLTPEGVANVKYCASFDWPEVREYLGLEGRGL